MATVPLGNSRSHVHRSRRARSELVSQQRLKPALSSPYNQTTALPPLRLETHEAARMLRMSRAQLYNRMREGSIKAQKDGARTYITRTELERYVASCG
jgi:excisionase family DNA binding protein